MPLLTTQPQVRCTFFTERGNLVASSFLPDTTNGDQIVSVTTHKSLGEPAGRFQIVLTCDTLGKAGGWKDLLRGGDMVVIEMGPDRPQPPDTFYGRSTPEGLKGCEIVMIGTVDDVRFRSAISGDGRPEQHITVTGRDFGKYL